jgi:hypothetical protein
MMNTGLVLRQIWNGILQCTSSRLFFHLISVSVFLLLPSLLIACTSVQYAVQEPYYVTENVTENVTGPYSEKVPSTTTVSHEQVITPYIIWSNPEIKFMGNAHVWYYGYNLSDMPVSEKKYVKITFFKQEYYENLSFSIFDITPRGQLLAPPQVSTSDAPAPAAAGHWITAPGDISTYQIWLNAANHKLDFAHFLGGASNIFLNLETPAPITVNTRGSKDIALIIYGPAIPRNCRFITSLQWEETVTENITVSGQRSVPVQAEQRTLKQRTVMKTRQIPFWESLLNASP